MMKWDYLKTYELLQLRTAIEELIQETDGESWEHCIRMLHWLDQTITERKANEGNRDHD